MSNVKKEAGWIGSTSYAAKEGRGDHPGCKCMTFWSVYSYNRYFEKNASLLVIEEHFIPVLFGLITKVVVMITNQLTAEEMADYHEVGREVEFAMAERRKARAVERENQEAEGRRLVTENLRLAEVGRKCEARVKHMRSMDPSSPERKATEKLLNAGDPEILNALMEGQTK